MKTLLRGPNAAKTATKNQLLALHKQFPWAVVVGRFGRTALYSQFGWREAEPVPVLNENGDPRDLDIMLGRWSMAKVFACARPHRLDFELGNAYARPEGRTKVYLSKFNFGYEVPRSIFVTRTSLLDGVPVTTFTIGVQQQIERFVPPDPLYPEEQIKYDISHAQFDRFAEAMRPLHPEEFQPKSAIAALAEFTRLKRG